jgi:hypothetical protein
MSDAAQDRVTSAAVVEPRPRWWCDIRWIFAGVVAATVVFLLWNLFGPEPAIRVSRETTFLTGPLAADGLPDYGAAMLALAGPAPPPEENAAVVLLQTCWPMGIDPADLPAVCKALGIPNDPPPESLGDPTKDASAKITDEMYDAALSRPWTSEEFPELEAWLVDHKQGLDRLVGATALSRYWLADPGFLNGRGNQTDTWVFVFVMDLRRMSRILGCRAMWHVGEGRYADAWKDIDANCRLSRLVVAPESGPQFLVTRLVAGAIDAAAHDMMIRHLLARDDISRQVIADICRDLDRLDDLVPQYLPAVPIDSFSEKPLIYERRGDGYLLASVGRNGIYDGGDDNDGRIVKGEWKEEDQFVDTDKSDLVVRMPVPKRPFVPPAAP